jgi:hypothetical protein
MYNTAVESPPDIAWECVLEGLLMFLKRYIVIKSSGSPSLESICEECFHHGVAVHEKVLWRLLIRGSTNTASEESTMIGILWLCVISNALLIASALLQRLVLRKRP